MADQRIISDIRNCTYDGIGCTNSCEHRNTCRILRVPFLIQTRAMRLEFSKTLIEDGVFVSQYDIIDSNTDEYINELSRTVG